MKIVFIVENYYPHIGGVERLFQGLCERLSKKHKVVVVTHKLAKTKREERLNGVIIKRVAVPKFASRHFFSILAIPKALSECRDADIIHTTTYNGAIPAYIASKLLRKPCVITIMEVIGKSWGNYLDVNPFYGALAQRFEHFIVNLGFDVYCCISESTKRDFEEANTKKKGVVIYPGIDYAFWDSRKYDCSNVREALRLNGKFSYLYYGRPGVSKGFMHLLRAVPIIRQKIKDSVLIAILSKDKAYKNRYQEALRLIDSLGIRDSVRIVEPQAIGELPKYIKAADCVVVPSLTEGFGYSVAESCAMGKPVVASNVKSMPEIISGEYVLVKPKHPASIADGIMDVFSMKAKKKPLKKFLWDNAIRKYEAIYNEMLGNRR